MSRRAVPKANTAAEGEGYRRSRRAVPKAHGTSVALYIAPAAFHDLKRLQDFLADEDDPMAGMLLPFIMDALAILALQPGIGRPVEGGQRELIIHRGRSGYLARYDYQRGIPRGTVLRIRHHREAGYTAEEI